VLLALTSAATARSTHVQSDNWIGTWSAAPQPFMPAALVTFRNQTVRLIAHASVGGGSVRLRLSNTYGRGPVSIGAAKIALSGVGADVKPGSGAIVTFRGSRAVTIPAGATITSDPVVLTVPRFSDLAVSLFLPRATPAMTSHFLAMQSGYVSSVAGDQTGATHFKVGKTIHSWPFLTGIDVTASDATGAMVVFGDSTVDGDGSTEDANHRWPDEIARAVNDGAGGKDIAVLNEGIIGNRLLHGSPSDPPTQFGDALGESGIARFERDALSSPVTKWVIVRIGINDLGLPGSMAPASDAVTAARIIDGYRTLIRKAHQHGVKILGTTLGPFEGADIAPGYFSSEKEAQRQEVNAWIRAGGGFDGVVDLDALLKDPQRPSRLLPAFDSGDHLHPNDAGNVASAAVVRRQLFKEQ
ncbi:MAG TPA: SGNH/GDSL hydrolase family protein, partial [Xanthomonadaceae bacterium]|nr:SGNH/GDSL hydrolase family protein [Xanthomonadaceae bacterium]